jgi:hypothetical protein
MFDSDFFYLLYFVLFLINMHQLYVLVRFSKIFQYMYIAVLDLIQPPFIHPDPLLVVTIIHPSKEYHKQSWSQSVVHTCNPTYSVCRDREKCG